MSNRSTRDSIQTLSPRLLAGLLGQGLEEDGRLWSQGELADIWRHQMAASIEFDLSAMSQEPSDKVHASVGKHGAALKRFGDLLGHPSPPLDVLKMTKDYAKRRLSSGQDVFFPRDIALLLYYAAIATARLRCKCRISSLSDAELRKALNWGIGLSWLDETTRNILTECRTALMASQSRVAR